jgi:hypothetical protein
MFYSRIDVGTVTSADHRGPEIKRPKLVVCMEKTKWQSDMGVNAYLDGETASGASRRDQRNMRDQSYRPPDAFAAKAQLGEAVTSMQNRERNHGFERCLVTAIPAGAVCQAYKIRLPGLSRINLLRPSLSWRLVIK